MIDAKALSFPVFRSSLDIGGLSSCDNVVLCIPARREHGKTDSSPNSRGVTFVRMQHVRNAASVLFTFSRFRPSSFANTVLVKTAMYSSLVLISKPSRLTQMMKLCYICRHAPRRKHASHAKPASPYLRPNDAHPR
jgi:hypothetical protein